MIVDKPGVYRLLEDLTMRGPNSIGTMPKGAHLTITQVDRDGHQVIGPAFPDWHYWNLPVKPVKE